MKLDTYLARGDVIVKMDEVGYFEHDAKNGR